MTKAPNFSIRPYKYSDIALIRSYLTSLKPDELERMGIEVKVLAMGEQIEKSLTHHLSVTNLSKHEFAYLMWELDGVAIGYSSLKRIKFGLYGDMHLHITSPSARGQGRGAIWFCLSAIWFIRTYRLQLCICEPKADNPSPNGMLKKIGFAHVKDHYAKSSDIAQVAQLRQYLIQESVALHYLKRQVDSHGLYLMSLLDNLPK